jgi:hypothetical protein
VWLPALAELAKPTPRGEAGLRREVCEVTVRISAVEFSQGFDPHVAIVSRGSAFPTWQLREIS